MTELKYHSATSNLDSNHQWWVTLQKGTELDIMCLLIDSHITPYDILMTKKKKKIPTESDQASRLNYQFSGNS